MAVCAACGKDNTVDARFCSGCGAQLRSDTSAAAKVRKTVTVLFADVTGSTALAERRDPESVQQVMARYFAEVGRVLDRHGGTVEKFIGDAVMAVFGIPVVHEDDALRAVRAAVEMLEAVAALNAELERRFGVEIQFRIGINTGEVVAGDHASRQSFATGDAVNVAARLQTAAAPGEILIGESTFRLVRGRARASSVEPLALKGKRERIRAHRLTGLVPEAGYATRALATPFVGRERELALLHESFDSTVAAGTCRLLTVLGPAGIGKSRLVQEFHDVVGAGGRFLVGRCVPYGEGITYWPLAEIVKQVIGDGGRDAIADVLEADEDAGLIADRVAGAVGVATGRGSSDETGWAVRRFLTALARDRPLVVVLDELQWAEPTFLDLVEAVGRAPMSAPVLLLCIARDELLDVRPGWQLRAPAADLVRLEPLTEPAARAVVESFPGAASMAAGERARLLEAAEGNPLFLEQMLAMSVEHGAGAVSVPPTIQAVLAARIDRLPAGERTLIEHASVAGKTFDHSAVVALVPESERASVDRNLAGLVRRELIRPTSSAFAGDQGFRFGHILIRDAAYQFLPKQTRSELHERFAAWLERTADEQAREYDAILGYHLEQAFRYRADLGPVGKDEFALATAAAKRLESSGCTALGRNDLPAAVNLLNRAASLLPDAAARAALLPHLGAALGGAGKLSEAEAVLTEAVEHARAGGDERLEASALVERILLRLQVETEAATNEGRELFDRLLRVFVANGDDHGLAKLWRLRGLLEWLAARSAAADEAWKRAAEHAERAGDDRELADVLLWLASSAWIGPTPAKEAIRRCEEILEGLRGDRLAGAVALKYLAGLHAMAGRFGRARALLAESRAIVEDLGFMSLVAADTQVEASVASVAGEYEEAERLLRAGAARLAEMGEKALLATTLAQLGQVLYAQGRYDEARHLTEVSADAGAPEDLSVQMLWRRVRAKIVVRDGRHEEAERLAREAVALAERTDWPSDHGDALLDLGEVLFAAGRADEAESSVRQALTFFQEKGNVVAAAKAESFLAGGVPA